MARSVASVVVSKEDWAKLPMIAPTLTPRPICPFPAEVYVLAYTKSAKSMRWPRKPTVLTLARLLPTTFIFSPWARRPDTLVHMLALRLMMFLLLSLRLSCGRPLRLPFLPDVTGESGGKISPPENCCSDLERFQNRVR